MSKYIKLEDAIDAVMNTEAVFADVTAEPYQKTRDVTQALHNLPTIEVSEDAISRANLIKSFLADCECESREEAGAVTLKLEDMLELIEEEPSVIPQVPRKHTR